MNNLKFQCISDLSYAEKIWKALSPNKVLYDDWHFRYVYYKYFNYPLYFYTAFEKDKPVGLLPLMFDEKKGHLDFFAGFSYMEDNAVWTKKGYEEVIPKLVNMVDQPAVLEYMRPDMKIIKNAVIHDYNYFLNLKGFKTYEDFLLTLDGKKRRNIVSQVRKLQAMGVSVKEGDENSIDYLEKWNRKRFGEHSSFAERPHWNEFFRSIVRDFPSRIVEAYHNGENVGVGFVIFYKNICYGINAGYNPEYTNVGKYIILIKFQAGIDAGKEIYDAGGSGAFGWKEDFKLSKKPQYLLKIK